ncbi:hypothetical protein POM88_037038 [Heracleum sosnowskyi]|uniref:F-box associated domain-containing protein n=1 Tax=Heracleum sosnowskyi TaxID=360622 RepID=A0AAD8HQF8_9APIA|nr:hypothetical protein POM88_037038 [Heracleum sosnowskyi]
MIPAATIPMVKFPAISIYDSYYGVCNGLLYNAEGLFNTRRILVSNPLRSQFTILPPLPLKGDTHERLFMLLDIQGNLGMLDFSCDRKIDIWVMDYEKSSCGKEYTFDITIVGEIDVVVTQVIGVWKQDEILFCFYGGKHFMKYWSYSTRTGNLKKCERPTTKSQEAQAYYSHKWNLISIPGATKVS